MILRLPEKYPSLTGRSLTAFSLADDSLPIWSFHCTLTVSQWARLRVSQIETSVRQATGHCMDNSSAKKRQTALTGFISSLLLFSAKPGLSFPI